MAIEITEALVNHVARLSRLGISGPQLKDMMGHFRKVLEYVKVLDGLDLGGIEPSIFPLSITNVFRPDAAGPSLPVEEALRNAPAARDGCFLVPRIVAEAGGSGRGAPPSDFEESA